MCGFTTYFSYHNISPSDLDHLVKANEEMSYRGPDESGIWNDEKVGMGHVRLSIIGVNNGRQPLRNENRDVTLVCNGEIYNYPFLRKDLESKGHVFSSDSDCEVIVHLYEEYGGEFVSKLDGMFAYCLWDQKKEQLHFGRDRGGKKPLYYYEDENGFALSSEVKVLKKHFVKCPKVNYEVIRQTQKYSYSISKTDTYIEQVKKLPFAQHGILSSIPGPVFKSYYERNYTPTFSGEYREACRNVRELLFESVSKRLQSEVPVAIMLSAGIDSSSIAAIASQLGNEVNVIVAGYKGDYDVDERVEAKKFATESGFRCFEIELDASDFDGYLDEILPILDEPNGDISMFAQWGIYKKAKELGFKVLLSGNGSDEIFYGYPQFNHFSDGLTVLDDFKSCFLVRSRKEMIANLFKFFGENDLFSLRRRFQTLNTFLPHPDIEKMAGIHRIPLEREDWLRCTDANAIDQFYYFLHSAWLPNNCYFLGDKLAMGNSIEVRAPFADCSLIDFIDSLPLRYKYDHNAPKKLLKDALNDLLPEYILKRKKTGFNAPKDFWFSVIERRKKINSFKRSPDSFPQLVSELFIEDK